MLSGNHSEGLAGLVSGKSPIVVPGVADAMTARIAEEVGFKAVFVTGAGLSNAYLGVADLGLITLTELAAHVASIREAVDIPIMVDADTGFGGPLNVARTVRVLARAGANAIEIEDQTFPKRCGHFDGKNVVNVGEMATRLSAALDSRPDDSVLIIARTDARSVNGIEDAIERAELYSQLGADIIFVEAPENLEEIRAIPRRVPAVHVLNIVEGGITPNISFEDARNAGYSIILYANAALRGAINGIRNTLEILRDDGSTQRALSGMASWEERQTLVRKAELEAAAARYEAASANLHLRGLPNLASRPSAQ